MDVNQEVNNLLKKEKTRLMIKIKKLEIQLDKIWKHALLEENGNEIIYISSDLSDEDIKKRKSLEQKINEAKAKLAIFDYLMNLWSKYDSKTTNVPTELAEYSNIAISSDLIIVNKDKRKSIKYGFLLSDVNCKCSTKPSIPFQTYMKLYENNLRNTLLLIFLKSKEIIKDNLSNKELLEYQTEYCLEITKVLAQSCSNVLQEEQQVTHRTK